MLLLLSFILNGLRFHRWAAFLGKKNAFSQTDFRL